ncbi:alpha/beta hydrolase family protein, partial [Sphingomonas sp.]|uniref:alpha/beta hydrolase family protein n=1 Tax=Sphingomonas sp. TaxID=28214 RepID=UPI002C6E9921
MRKLMLCRGFLGLGLLASTALSAGIARAEDSTAARFGAREHVQGISLSPDGTKVAILTPLQGRGVALTIGDLVAGGLKVITSSSGDPEQIERCAWTNATRLICTISTTSWIDGQRAGFSRLIAINSDGSDIKMVTARASSRALGVAQHGGALIDWGSDDASGSALITRDYVPEETTGSHIASNREGRGVDLVDIQSGKRRAVEAPRLDAVEYISDGHGTVRVMGVRPRTSTGYEGTRTVYFYRKPNDRNWEKLETGDGGFEPYIVDREQNVAFGFAKTDGRQALYKVALDGSLKKDLVLARPDVDVDGLLTVGRHRRLIGVSYATDTRVAEWFDPAFVKLRDSLGKALPNSPIISFADASSDESRILMFAGSDVDAGGYFIFDKNARKLQEVLPVRPQLAGLTLSPVKPVTYPAGDGTRIPGYLTLPPGATSTKGLPAIVMPHGGPGARDEWGFDWLSQYFAQRGFAVLRPNFRGSTGYGDAWFQKNGFQSWRTAVGDVNDGGKWLIAEGVDPGKLAVFGWSYGGYAALQSSALDAN